MVKLSLKGHKRLYNFFVSRNLTIGLLAALCLFLAVTTFIEGHDVIIWYPVRILLGLLILNLSFCTVHRIKLFSAPVLVIHIGIIIAFAGGGISSYGYVATVNVYEGTMVDTVYRWDVKKNVPLEAGLMVEKLHERYYPVPVKVGVLKDEEKIGLYTLNTGETFKLENYSIRVDSLELPSENLKLSIFNNGEYAGYADTSGTADFPPGFPFVFKLVAYKDPVVMRTWVDLKLIKNSKTVAEGSTEVNSPLKWRGLKFHHTATGRDKYGNTYAGIQIVRDPGAPVVYAGFCIIAFGGTYYILRRMRIIK